MTPAVIAPLTAPWARWKDRFSSSIDRSTFWSRTSFGDLDPARGEVEDRPDARRDQPIGDGLRRLGGHGDDADLDGLRLHDARQLGERLDGERR